MRTSSSSLHGLTLAWMLCMVLNKRVTNFGRKFGNRFARTILTEPHVLVPPYQVDGEILIGRQVGLLGSWLKLKPEIAVVELTRTRYKLYCNGVTILISFIVSRL
ncbi:hypothetical protein CFP56_026048 [Quercus suber]|uniref:Uncharacterized protein n=1 Tax=Quercus suber TaxID=58331 RepID=A0AAW0K1E2_QUESU